MIGVYVPTYGRPQSSSRLVDNLRESTSTLYRLIFVCDRQEDYTACAATGSDTLLNTGEGYSDAVQTAYEADESDLFLAGNDDFDFQPGWDTAAIACLEHGAMVACLNDGSLSPNRFKTVALVRRSYIEQHSGVVDMPNRVFFPYRHNYVDTEFHATAWARGVAVDCESSVVIHRHPDWGLAQDDATYRRSKSRLGEDGSTFDSRAHLWQRIATSPFSSPSSVVATRSG